jgi:hypothetical protein
VGEYSIGIEQKTFVMKASYAELNPGGHLHPPFGSNVPPTRPQDVSEAVDPGVVIVVGEFMKPALLVEISN